MATQNDLQPITATLLNATTTVAAGTAQKGNPNQKTFQASGTTTAGTGAATIQVQGSNDAVSWDVIGTITLTLGTVSTSDSFTSADRYANVRGNVTAISGTGAAVSLTMAV